MQESARAELEAALIRLVDERESLIPKPTELEIRKEIKEIIDQVFEIEK